MDLIDPSQTISKLLARQSTMNPFCNAKWCYWFHPIWPVQYLSFVRVVLAPSFHAKVYRDLVSWNWGGLCQSDVWIWCDVSCRVAFFGWWMGWGVFLLDDSYLALRLLQEFCLQVQFRAVKDNEVWTHLIVDNLLRISAARAEMTNLGSGDRQYPGNHSNPFFEGNQWRK